MFPAVRPDRPLPVLFPEQRLAVDRPAAGFDPEQVQQRRGDIDLPDLCVDGPRLEAGSREDQRPARVEMAGGFLLS